MGRLTANSNPTRHHRRAFRQGWNDALRVLHNNRLPYQKPEENTWMAIGYRHGRQNRTDDEDAIVRAWEWSLEELRRTGYVDETRFH